MDPGHPRLGVVDLTRNGVYGYDIMTELLNAEFEVLKRTRSSECFRRHEDTAVPNAFATVAGAGPKSSAVVMKNVSETVMLALADPAFMENVPVNSASAANTSQT